VITSSWLHHLSSVESRADTFGQFTTLLGDPGLVEQALPRLLDVTADEVVALAADVLGEGNRAAVRFVPQDSVEVAA
jgi:predicted Zn-dependent peptidase